MSSYKLIENLVFSRDWKKLRGPFYFFDLVRSKKNPSTILLWSKEGGDFEHYDIVEPHGKNA